VKATWKLTFGVGVGALVIAGIAITLRPNPLAVDTALVTRSPLERTIDAEGRTRVRERYVVVAPVAGRVERITRIEGALVRAGDVVARLTALPLDSQAIAQARARLDGADAVVLEGASQVRAASAFLEQRRRELSRARRLAEVGGVSPRVVEESQLAVTQAEEAERAAIERSRATEADARQARAILAGQERGAQATVLVRAPASGRVLRVSERSERIVAAGTRLLEVGDLSSLEIVVDVLSSDGAAVHQGDRVRLAEWGRATNGELGATTGGRVRDVEPAAFTKTSALGVEEQRVNVIIDPDRVPPMVGDGFRVEASIIVWSTRDAVVVPRSALLQAGNEGSGPEWTAFVVKAGKVERRVVRVGHVGGASAEVLMGVEPGEIVVVFPSDRVASGIRVKGRKA
jgi:HlyD family secretion protein